MSRRDWALDGAVALFLVLWAQAEVWAGGAENLVGPRWANAVGFTLAAALALIRRWRPLVVLLAQCATIATLSLAVGDSETLAGLLPLLVGVYTVAAYAPRRHVLWGTGVVTAMSVIAVARDPLLDEPTDYLGATPFIVVILIAWLLGDYTRTRRLYVAELRLRAEAAERDREVRARLAVVEERARIARELHDVIAHGITVMVRQADAASARLPQDPVRAHESIEAVGATGREALTELRRLVELLGDGQDSPAAPDGASLGGDALERLAERVTAAGLQVRLRNRDGLDDVAPGPRLAVYRIVQEALTNALRHASAHLAVVDVRRDGDDVVAEIVDDGHGMLLAQRSIGHGLLGMQQRAQMYGGTVAVAPAVPHGTRVVARLPTTQASLR